MYALLRVPSALQALDAKLEISADLRVARLFLWPARARDDPSMRVRLWEITSDARAVRRGREVDGVRAGWCGAARLRVPLGALTERGLRVTDIWETKEQFEQFEQFEQYAREKIGPYSEQVGIPSPLRITFFNVHNYQASV